MSRFYESESLSPEARSGLRNRVIARRLLIALLALFVAFIIASAFAPARLGGLLTTIAVTTWLFLFASNLFLLFGACPRCDRRFAEPSIANMFFFPSPSAFASSCAHCGVPLSRAG